MPYREGKVPRHSAMAATYAHATAPLRRLGDRYVGLAARRWPTGCLFRTPSTGPSFASPR